MNRRGYTLIELLVTLTIVAILANIALPALQAMKRKADAAHVIADINAIRVAGFDAYADLHVWPATNAWGVSPLTLIPRTPRGFQWRYKSVEYRWQRWALPNGMPTSPNQTVLVGISVRTTDQQLLATIKGLHKGPVAFGTSTEVTFIIE